MIVTYPVLFKSIHLGRKIVNLKLSRTEVTSGGVRRWKQWDGGRWMAEWLKWVTCWR